jgi:hypothetical protein
VDPQELSGGAQIGDFSELPQPDDWADSDLPILATGRHHFWLRAWPPLAKVRYKVASFLQSLAAGRPRTQLRWSSRSRGLAPAASRAGGRGKGLLVRLLRHGGGRMGRQPRRGHSVWLARLLRLCQSPPVRQAFALQHDAVSGDVGSRTAEERFRARASLQCAVRRFGASNTPARGCNA